VVAWNIPQLKPVNELIDAAAVAGRALPLETHHAYPIPVRDAKGLRILVFHCHSAIDLTKGLRLWAPGYRTWLRADTAKFEELKEMTAEELGGLPGPVEEIGAYALPAGMDAKQFVALQERLYQLHDMLVPLFAAGQERVSPEQRQAAADFRTIFGRVTEPSLQPYYQIVGNDFFAWLDRISRA